MKCQLHRFRQSPCRKAMCWMSCRIGLPFLFICWACCGAWCPLAQAQSSSDEAASLLFAQSSQTTGAQQATPAHDESKNSLTFFPHSESSRYWISGQANLVFQWHPSFPAKYTGAHSLQHGAEHAATRVFTL